MYFSGLSENIKLEKENIRLRNRNKRNNNIIKFLIVMSILLILYILIKVI